MAADRSGVSQRDRHLPFGVQLLLAAGIILLIVIVARQFTVVPAKDEDKAVDAIHKGGSVSHREPPDEIETPFGTYRRSWFTPILGKSYFRSILRIRIWPHGADVVLPHSEKRAEASAVLPQFAQLRSCEEVVLRGTRVADADLKHLARVPGLRLVDLGATSIGDAGVKELAAARDLEVLDLEHTRVTDQAAASLAAMPKLHEVNLEGTFVTDHAVQRLKETKPELVVNWAPAPSEEGWARAAEFGATHLAAVGELAIRAVRCESGATGYAVALQWGSFRRRRVPPPPRFKVQTRAEALGQLLRLPHLVRLKLYGGSLEAEDLDDLAKLETVRELYLYDCNFIFRGVAEHFTRLANLRKLVLVRVPLSSRELELICILPRLEVLTLQWPQPYYQSTDEFWNRSELVAINNEGLECLGQMPHLRKLVLRTPKRREWEPAKLGEIGDPGLAYIKTLPNLEYLDLSGTKVTPAGLLRLEGMAKLREVVILGVPVDADQEAKLRRALPQATIRTGPLERTESERLPYAMSGQKSLAELLREPDPIP